LAVPSDDASAHPGLDDLALAYDAALANGADAPQPELPADLLPKWQKLEQCLLRLEADRSRSQETPGKADGRQHSLGRFQILRELGRGGFGIVYLAVDTRLRRQVALKVPRPDVLLSDELVRRLHREAEAAARLSHPNLVGIHEVGDAGPICYLVTDYCPGPTLSAWLRQQTAPVAPATSAHLLYQLAQAVSYMHDRGVVHRDIKPGNILLQETPGSESATQPGPKGLVPKLTDFGLAKVAESVTRHTRAGTVLGTLAYMAPEQADGRTADTGPLTDVYALGAVLYECLTGKPPFQGVSEADTLRQLLHDEPARPTLFLPNIPRDLETIC
jgi:serine/threonine protein kinase